MSWNIFMSDFNIALENTLKWEGEYVNHPDDKGGETNKGITLQTARDFGYTGNMKDIPFDIIKEIYFRNYWLKVKCDKIDNQDIANNLFDSAVLHGQGRAGMFLQKTLNNIYHSDLVIDGIIGNITLSVLDTIIDIKDFVKEFKNIRIKYCEKVAESNQSQSVFLKGWINRINAI